MADIFLSQGETLPNGPFPNSRYFGNTGNETIGLTDSAVGITVSQTIEKIILPGDSTSYLFQQQGNRIAVFEGTTLVAQITVQSDADGTQLQFADKTASVQVSSAGMTLGGATVPANAPGAVTGIAAAASAAIDEASAPLSHAELALADGASSFLLNDPLAGQAFA